jgi:hypothetical protein
MKNILVLTLIAIVGLVPGFVDAKITTPFEYDASDIQIKDYTLDFKDIEIILDVEVTKSTGTIEINFERNFFDSKYLGKDDSFTIIADGDLVSYTETQTTQNSRTIKMELVSGTKQVEIFGTHLKGITANIPESKSVVKSTIEIIDQSQRINELVNENKQLKSENEALKEENKHLDSRIFELENLVSALKIQVNNLNTIITEQVKVIYNWVLGNSLT